MISTTTLMGRGNCTNSLLIVTSLVCLLVSAINGSIETGDDGGVFIVYMGGSNSNVDLHSELVSSLSERVLHTYVRGFLGFAAVLTGEEAESISDRPEVVSVFPDRLYSLHTTRSWDFLEQEIAGGVPMSNATIAPGDAAFGTDVIVGILDTGIWPDSDSFGDAGMPPIPSRWKGVCMEGTNFDASTCNRKLIGARFYDGLSPWDTIGHGTHVASIAAGRFVPNASYYGLARGTARGGSPNSRIAMYRVCLHTEGCLPSYILQAFEDAIFDQVDVLSVSIGHMSDDLSKDAVAIGSFHAVERGITVICSAGNDGPHPGSLMNVAPWILTVAATTIDRLFQTELVLGSNRIIKGGGISFSDLLKDPVYPLIDGVSAKLGYNRSTEPAARSCTPGSLDASKVRGSIVVCENIDDDTPISRFSRLHQQYHVIGMIVIAAAVDLFPIGEASTNFGSRPIIFIGADNRAVLLDYIKSIRNPTATILWSLAALSHQPAPVVARFSSRGPAPTAAGIIKPDIAAPGVDILAAWPGFVTDKMITGTEPPRFAVLSGTSIACPHVSGLAARVKSQHPTWGPSAVKSAIMTTAITKNNLGSEITIHTGERATPYDIGAGEISLSGPIQPGLVYETNMPDYVSYMCSIGYKLEKIRLIAPDIVGDNFTCPSRFELNYPSICLSKLKRGKATTVSRTVTNVGEEESTYEAFVDSPPGLHVRVVPRQLKFTKGVQKLEFKVIFQKKRRTRGAVFGSVGWKNAERMVRSPFVVNTSTSRGYAWRCLVSIHVFLLFIL